MKVFAEYFLIWKSVLNSSSIQTADIPHNHHLSNTNLLEKFPNCRAVPICWEIQWPSSAPIFNYKEHAWLQKKPETFFINPTFCCFSHLEALESILLFWSSTLKIQRRVTCSCHTQRPNHLLEDFWHQCKGKGSGSGILISVAKL